jgi:stress-induced morphogen
MDTEEVERLIEEGIEGAAATVRPSRGAAEDDHLAAVVVAPVFEDASLVDQHDMVYEALDGYMTSEIHALELQTYTPREYEQRDSTA